MHRRSRGRIVLIQPLLFTFVRPVADVSAVRQSFIFSQQHFKEIFMIAFDQNDSVLLHQLKDKNQQLRRFHPSVKEVTQDDELMRLCFCKEAGLLQRVMEIISFYLLFVLWYIL